MSKFGVIVTTRAFFPGFLALDAREIVLRRLKSMGHQAVIIDEDATKYGPLRATMMQLNVQSSFEIIATRLTA